MIHLNLVKVNIAYLYLHATHNFKLWEEVLITVIALHASYLKTASVHFIMLPFALLKIKT